MSPSTHTRSEESNARELYRDLTAAGVTLHVEERPDRPGGLVIRIGGLGNLPKERAALARWSVQKNRAALARMLAPESSTEPDPERRK